MKKIRLPEYAYSLKNSPCLITICSKDKKGIYSKSSFTRFSVDLLIELSKKNGIVLLAYCFMPDHVHFVVAVDEDKSIVDLVRKFKSISTIKSRRFGFEGRIYQNRFYDHFIRKDEGLEKTVKYVLNNPVRKGLVEAWEDFPYSGFCL